MNGWVRRIFARKNVDETVAALLLADAETRLKRHQAAIAAGVDPAALVEVINEAQAEREADGQNWPTRRVRNRSLIAKDSIGSSASPGCTRSHDAFELRTGSPDSPGLTTGRPLGSTT